MATLDLTQSQIQATLRSFLLGVLPPGVEVVQGQDNRVPEPKGTDFVVMTIIVRDRLATNIDVTADALFTGSIAGPTMTITAVTRGALSVGSPVFGPTVAANTYVAALGSGTGGTGTYTVAPGQSVAASPRSAGTTRMTQETMLHFQLDVHGPASSDNSQIISTAFRDAYAVDYFRSTGLPVRPLYTDDPKQMPFINDQQQYEYRYIVETFLQANQTVIVPQQYADSVVVGIIEVDATYPP